MTLERHHIFHILLTIEPVRSALFLVIIWLPWWTSSLSLAIIWLPRWTSSLLSILFFFFLCNNVLFSLIFLEFFCLVLFCCCPYALISRLKPSLFFFYRLSFIVTILSPSILCSLPIWVFSFMLSLLRLFIYLLRFFLSLLRHFFFSIIVTSLASFRVIYIFFFISFGLVGFSIRLYVLFSLVIMFFLFNT